METEQIVTIYPDGSGKVQLHMKFLKDMSGMMLMNAKDDAGRKKAVDDALYGALVDAQGLDGWANAAGRLDNGLIVLEATGYFSDLNRLKLGKGDQVGWTRGADGSYTLSWKSNPDPDAKSKSMLDQSDTEFQNMQQMMGSMMEGMKLGTSIVMPGEISASKGLKEHHGRVGRVVLTGDDFRKEMTAVANARQGLKDGKLTHEQAQAAIDKADAALRTDLQITSRPAVPPAELSAFQKELAQVRKTYPGSDLAQKVAEAKKEKDEQRAKEEAEKKASGSP